MANFFKRLFGGKSSDSGSKESIATMFGHAVKGDLRDTIYASQNGATWICDIPDNVKNDFRKEFRIDIDEKLLWVRDTSFWSSRNQGMVITDKGFHFIPDNDNHNEDFFISWNNIKEVKYRDLQFIFYTHDGKHKPISQKNFFYSIGDNAYFKAALNKLADLFTKMATMVGYVWDDVSAMIDAREYDKARKQLNDAIEPSNPNNVALTNLYLGNSYLSERNSMLKKNGIKVGINNDHLFRFGNILAKAGYDLKDEELNLTCIRLEREAVSCYEKAISAFKIDKSLNDDEKGKWISSIHHKLAQVAPTMERARTYIIEGLDADSGEYLAEENYKTLTTEIANGNIPFTQKYDYKNRRFLFVVNDYNSLAGCYDGEGNIPWVFALEDIPAEIQFPVGHPQAKTLYIGHPLKPNVYIPFENATAELFIEKIRELTYLAQCLGATEVKFRKVKGSDVSSSWMSKVSNDVSAEIKLANAKYSDTHSSNQGETHKKNDAIEHILKFNPIKAPYCPTGLVWLEADASCQAMVKSRLNGGNMTNYSEHVSSSETTTVSSSQLKSIKGSFDHLLIKASGSRDVKDNSTFSKATETEWEVNITFKPWEEFDTPVRPKQELTDDEQEYIDMIRDIIVDGAIPNAAKKLLSRERKSLNLTDKRAEELEQIVLKETKGGEDSHALTEVEQEYMDCLNDVCIDGSIPDSARRLLERTRKSLNLSEERAEELERMAKLAKK